MTTEINIPRAAIHVGDDKKTYSAAKGAEQVSDKDAEVLSNEIAKKIQNEMVYPGQVKITVIRETRSVAFAK